MPNFRSIRKATIGEIADYRETGPVYPLFGFIYMRDLDGKPVRVYVEYLGGLWTRPDPVYEIVFPEGYNASHCHSLLCTDLKDVVDRAGEWLDKCSRGGGCGCTIDEGE